MVRDHAGADFPGTSASDATAVIKLKPGYSFSSPDMEAFLKASMAPFKVPKSPTGKILKRELRKQFPGSRPAVG